MKCEEKLNPTERKLASIRKIKEIRSIEGAENIELLIIDGWQVVAKKGDFLPGDLCVYFEIDSYLPIRKEFEFLRKNCYKEIKELNQTGFRLKTIKLRGQISQGLAMKIKDFEILNNVNLGDDVTDLLDVKKYEPPIPAQLAGEIEKHFPQFIPKTDIERIQNIYDEIKAKYCDLEFEVSVKLDGTSMTVYKKDEKIGVCSKNYELKYNDNNTYCKAAEEVIGVLKNQNINLAIQGELIGPGIQKNRDKLLYPTFYIFNIFDIDKQNYFSSDERLLFINDNKLTSVPIISINMKILNKTLEELLNLADGKSLNSECREGVVCKNKEIQFKIINNKYLLKND